MVIKNSILLIFICFILFTINGCKSKRVVQNSITTNTIEVYFFLLDDCVICQAYSSKIRRLHEKYGNDFDMTAIFPNFSSKPKQIEQFLKEYNIPLPYKTDYYKLLTRKYEVSVTPEIVVYDQQNEKVLYKGRIDNQFVDIGKRRQVVTTNELEETLLAIKQGKDDYLRSSTAVGCIINMNEMEQN